jgi:hypothetical protein
VRPSIIGKENQVRVNFTIRNGPEMVGEDIEENCILRSFAICTPDITRMIKSGTRR